MVGRRRKEEGEQEECQIKGEVSRPLIHVTNAEQKQELDPTTMSIALPTSPMDWVATVVGILWVPVMLLLGIIYLPRDGLF
jgi:hypothetical protein